MNGDFWNQIGVMALTFSLSLVPALASRRMERSDQLTLIGVVIATFVVAVLPGILVFGLDKNSATYVLGGLFIMGVATLNRRFPDRPRKELPAAPGVAAESGQELCEAALDLEATERLRTEDPDRAGIRACDAEDDVAPVNVGPRWILHE